MARNASIFALTRPAAPASLTRPAVQLGNVLGVVELLKRAQANGLLYPKLWLAFADGCDLRITVAGERSSTPGYLMLTDGKPFDSNQYFGRISLTGELEIGRNGHARAAELAELLGRLAADPAKVAAEYGSLTGHCSFCRVRLSDARSIFVGYGRKCASKYGLPWGERS